MWHYLSQSFTEAWIQRIRQNTKYKNLYTYFTINSCFIKNEHQRLHGLRGSCSSVPVKKKWIAHQQSSRSSTLYSNSINFSSVVVAEGWQSWSSPHSFLFSSSRNPHLFFRSQTILARYSTVLLNKLPLFGPWPILKTRGGDASLFLALTRLLKKI